jgi:leader peptidase (prepilin peptidase) / N-methyltransferase
MNPLFVFILFILLGAAWGSFLVAWLYRFNARKSMLKGRSHCVACGIVISWYDLVPVVSYVVLRGKCRKCKVSLSYRYLFVELANVFLFGLTAAFVASRGLSGAVLFLIVLVGLVFLSMIFFFELYYGIVWASLLIFGSILVFIGNVIIGVPALSLVYGALIGSGVFFVQWWLSRGAWVGEGDIWIGVFMGVLLGWRYVLLALFLAYVIGAFVSVLLIVTKKISRKDRVSFGIYLSFATWITWLFGNDILIW